MGDYSFTQEQFQDIFEGMLNEMVNGILVAQDDGDKYPIIFSNREFNQLIGREPATIHTGHAESAFDVIYEADHNKARHAMQSSNEAEAKIPYRLTTMSDNTVWVLVTHKHISDAKGKYLFFNFVNIHELMNAQDKLRADSSKWSDIVNNIPIGLVLFTMDLEEEDCRVITVNNRLVSFANEVGRKVDGNKRDWGTQELTVILSQNIYAFAANVDIPDVRRMISESILSDVTTCTFRLRGSTKENSVWIRSFCHSKIMAGSRIFYVTFSDCTAEKKSLESLQDSHEQLRVLSYHDALTNLYNRNAINELCDYTFQHPIKNAGIAFADLNGLKHVNDTFGHRFGDRMIQRFADILLSNFTLNDCFRISGDEFVIVAQGISKEDFRDRMTDVIQRAKEANEIASIGFVWEEQLVDVRHAMDAVEQIMYVEKQRYYAETEVREAKRHNKYLANLLEELEHGQYICYLQPKADIDSHTFIGAEALIRKIDSKGQIIPPNLFIPILEHEKLIPRIDFFMLEEVCKILHRWEEEGRRPIKISVNMSRVTLAEYDYMEHLINICEKYQINRSLLELEITESNATMDHNLLVDEVEQIKALGIGVSIDDMGTEYSSLRMMMLNGIDTIKLDRSFILQMTQKTGRILIKQMIQLCKELKLHSIAEGVETEEQREELKELGCDSYQGYLLSKPVPIAEFEALMDQES